MKRITNLMLVAILSLVAIFISSCSEEQSSLQLSDIPTNAKIKGTLCYDAGYDYLNKSYVRLINPAANKKVYVEVKNSSFKSGAQGCTTYETKTNEKGEYEIVIPAVKNTSVTIIGETFIDTHSAVEDVKVNIPVFKTTESVYSFTSTIVVNPYDIKVCDGMYELDGIEVENPNAYSAKFIVKVGLPEYGKTKQQLGENLYSDYYIVSRQYKPATSVNVIAVVDDDHCYGATTNVNGEATFIIPSEHSNWTANVRITVLPYVVNSFKYYVEEQDKAGDYVVNAYNIEGGILSGGVSEIINFSGIKNDKTPERVLGLRFTPFEGIETYGYSYYEWNGIDVEF